jgi:hypothetical protein
LGTKVGLAPAALVPPAPENNLLEFRKAWGINWRIPIFNRRKIAEPKIRYRSDFNKT